MDSKSIEKEILEIMKDNQEHERSELINYFIENYSVDEMASRNALSRLVSKDRIKRVRRGVYIISEKRIESIADTINSTFEKIRINIECMKVNPFEYCSDSLSSEEKAEIDRKINIMKKIYDEVCAEISGNKEEKQVDA